MLATRNPNRLFSIDPFEMFARDFSPVYGVDVREDADKLYVEAELPGFKKDEVEIVLDKSVLTISAKHAEMSKTADDTAEMTDTPAQPKWLHRERQVRDYKRAFRLPASADGATVEAKLEDGVLYLTLTKREETKPRRIVVA